MFLIESYSDHSIDGATPGPGITVTVALNDQLGATW